MGVLYPLTDHDYNFVSPGDVSVFSSAILQETAAAKEQLKAIENRHADFLKLEASIREVSLGLDRHI